MEETVLLQSAGHIATLRLNRPQTFNALDEESLKLLLEKVNAVAADPEIRVLIVGSTSPKSFASGADIAQMLHNSPAQSERFCDLGFWAFQALADLPQPVIAAVGGHCLGGGLELAMACDLRIASRRAKFGYPEVRLGILPGWGGLHRTASAIGMARAKEMMFTGQAITAEEALRIGLVNQVVEPEALEDVCMQLAQTIAANAPLPIRLIKQTIGAAASAPPAAANAIADRAMGLCFSSDDQKEGMRAFLEKRPPVFRGR